MKKFLIIGNGNAITYKEIFPYVVKNKVWAGVSLNFICCKFDVPEHYDGNNISSKDGRRYAEINNAIWVTNIDHHKRHKKLNLDFNKRYNIDDYPSYDNYDAIEVSRIKNIPVDYDGVMGVPITFVCHYNPEQFEIVGEAKHGKDCEHDLFVPSICGKEIFSRILIKHRR